GRVQTAFAASLPAASASLADARASLIDGDYRKAQADFASIVNAYPGTPEAAEALLRQGEAALDDDNFTAAEDALRRFLSANGSHPLAPTAQLLLARTLEGANNGGAAAYAYAQYMASVDPVLAMGDLVHLRNANIFFGAGRVEDGWNELSAAARDADASGSAA